MHIVDDSFIGYNIEMLFQYDEQDGTSYVNWCHGIVESVCNAKKQIVSMLNVAKVILIQGYSQLQKRSCCHQNGTQEKQQKVHKDSILVKTRIKIFCHQNGL
jgi:hypothetical protein